MLSEDEEQFIDDVVEVGQALDQDVFRFMIDEGAPADIFLQPFFDYNFPEVLESLEKKDLVYTETVVETIHYNGGLRGDGIEPIKWENTGFKEVERRYMYFTERLEELYRG